MKCAFSRSANGSRPPRKGNIHPLLVTRTDCHRGNRTSVKEGSRVVPRLQRAPIKGYTRLFPETSTARLRIDYRGTSQGPPPRWISPQARFTASAKGDASPAWGSASPPLLTGNRHRRQVSPFVTSCHTPQRLPFPEDTSDKSQGNCFSRSFSRHAR